MWPNPQFPADLVTFTEEILNPKLFFLYNAQTKGTTQLVLLWFLHLKSRPNLRGKVLLQGLINIIFH